MPYKRLLESEFLCSYFHFLFLVTVVCCPSASSKGFSSETTGPILVEILSAASRQKRERNCIYLVQVT